MRIIIPLIFQIATLALICSCNQSDNISIESEKQLPHDDKSSSHSPDNNNYMDTASNYLNTKDNESKNLIILDKGNSEIEEKHSEKVELLNSKDAELFYNKAKSNLEDNYLSEAMVNINKSISNNPSNSNSYYIKGIIFERKLDYSNALGNFKRAISLQSTNVEAVMKCGIVYGKLNDKNNACLYFKKACDLGYNEACDGYNQFCQ